MLCRLPASDQRRTTTNLDYLGQMKTMSRLTYKTFALFSVFAGSLSAANAYLVHNLVADQPGIADHTDPNLVNPWGNAFSAGSPFWVGDNGTGLSTLYDGTGTPSSTVVEIPAAGGGTNGPVSGVVVNSVTTAFLLAAGKQSQFMFCSEDGVISGWNSSADATHAKVLLDNSKNNAVYKGMAIGTTTAGPVLFVANFNSGKVEVYDGNMNPIVSAGAFTNAAVPAGFAPFNIQVMNGKVFVVYAKPDAEKHDDVAGPGNGYVSVYDMSGNLLQSLIAAGNLNSPWGLAIAPATFGDFGGALLVGNFGDGKINAYNLTTGALMGTLNDREGNPIVIPGLWSINFGNGSRSDAATLYFTSGPNDENDGLLGSVQATPAFTSADVQNAASFSNALAPNTWASILKGGGMSATTRGWLASDFVGTVLPTQLNGVSVTVNGEPAAVSYISPTQVNFLVPPDIQSGAGQIVVTNNGLASAAATVTITSTAPAFFAFGAADATTGNSYIAAEHANGGIAGPPSLVTGVTSTPYNAGETMVLYGTGFGATNPAAPVGTTPTAALPLTLLPTATVGGIHATVSFGGLTGAGLYQFNVVLPAGTTVGGTGAVVEVPVMMTVGSAQTQAKAVVAVNAGQ
jgi:uncharacterized protein (TIGR03118 family)